MVPETEGDGRKRSQMQWILGYLSNLNISVYVQENVVKKNSKRSYDLDCKVLKSLY